MLVDEPSLAQNIRRGILQLEKKFMSAKIRLHFYDAAAFFNWKKIHVSKKSDFIFKVDAVAVFIWE